MLNSWIFISLTAGFAAAAMSASIVVPSPVSFVLFYMAPLPLFMAGLGWGPVAAGVAGLVGAIALAAGLGINAGLFFIASSAIAPIILSRVALINRPGQAVQGGKAAEGEVSDKGIEWYPEGRLVLWCAGLAVAMMALTIVIAGPDAESFQIAVSEQVELVFAEVAKQMPNVDKQQLDKASKAFVVLLPPLAATIWLLSTLFNLWAASRLLTASGRSLRPWAPFHQLTFPRASLAAIAGSILLAFVPGFIGLIGSIAVAVILMAFTLLGLAVIHSLTLGNPMRGFLLVSLYIALFIMGWVLILPLAGLGIMDMFLGMRARAAGTGPPNPD